jgi:hypothetical protein
VVIQSQHDVRKTVTVVFGLLEITRVISRATACVIPSGAPKARGCPPQAGA